MMNFFRSWSRSVARLVFWDFLIQMWEGSIDCLTPLRLTSQWQESINASRFCGTFLFLRPAVSLRILGVKNGIASSNRLITLFKGGRNHNAGTPMEESDRLWQLLSYAINSWNYQNAFVACNYHLGREVRVKANEGKLRRLGIDMKDWYAATWNRWIPKTPEISTGQLTCPWRDFVPKRLDLYRNKALHFGR
jgi:hypothetical protein